MCCIQTSSRGWSSVHYHGRCRSLILIERGVLCSAHTQTGLVRYPTLVQQTMGTHLLIGYMFFFTANFTRDVTTCKDLPGIQS